MRSSIDIKHPRTIDNQQITAGKIFTKCRACRPRHGRGAPAILANKGFVPISTATRTGFACVRIRMSHKARGPATGAPASSRRWESPSAAGRRPPTRIGGSGPVGSCQLDGLHGPRSYGCPSMSPSPPAVRRARYTYCRISACGRSASGCPTNMLPLMRIIGLPRKSDQPLDKRPCLKVCARVSSRLPKARNRARGGLPCRDDWRRPSQRGSMSSPHRHGS